MPRSLRVRRLHPDLIRAFRAQRVADRRNRRRRLDSYPPKVSPTEFDDLNAALGFEAANEIMKMRIAEVTDDRTERRNQYNAVRWQTAPGQDASVAYRTEGVRSNL